MNTLEIILLILLIAFGTAYNMYRHYSQRQFEEELNEALQTQGYASFCEMLGSRKGRRCYPRYTADMKKLDAAILCAQKYSREAEQVYDIYLLRRSNHIEELQTFAAKVKNPSSRAMAYYRIARQYYYMDDIGQCRKYLTMSKNVFPDLTWRSVIQKLLDGDYSEMDS